MYPRVASKLGQAVWLALAAVLALFTWQFLTVHYNYGGNWTALFDIRPGPVPSFLKSEKLFLFRKSGGYDGMIYHLIAHDPWMRKGSVEAIADPAFRYQRILVPMLAWLLAFGQDHWIHPAYFAVILLFAFLGVYWLSRFAVRIGLSPAWGLAFLLTPATLTSIDRMTVDIALAALTAGFALYAGESPDWRVLAVLTCAVLSRETGAALVAGYAIYLLSRKNLRGAFLVLSTALPGAAWFLYLAKARQAKPIFSTFVTPVPLSPFFYRLFHLRHYRVPGIERFAGQVLDEIGLLGAALALAYVAYLLIRRTWDQRAPVLYLLFIGALLIGPHGIWFDAYGYGRILTPLLLLVAMVRMRTGPVAAFLPIILIDARIGLNFVSQIRGVFHGLTGL